MKKSWLIVFLFPAVSWAQQQDLGTSTQTNQGARQVAKTEKFTSMPNVVDTTFDFTPSVYPVLPRTFPVSFTPEPIRPARLKVVDPLDKLYNGYVKAGVGMYTSAFLDAHYMTERNRDRSFSANYRHASAWDGIRNHSYSRFNDHHFSADGKYLLNKHVLKGGVRGDFNTLFFYSTPDSIGLGKDDLRQRFSGVGTAWSLSSYFHDSTKLNYNVFLTYDYFGDFRDKDSLKFDFAREHGFTLGTNLSRYFGREKFSLDAALDFNHYHPHAQNPVCAYCDEVPASKVWNNAIFSLMPSVETRGRWWSLKAGLGIYADLPRYSDESAKFYFYPDAEFRVSLFNDILAPYVGVDGSLKRNSFRSLAAQNPFILSGVELRNSPHQLRVYGGMRGALSSTLTFNFGVSHGRIASMPLFVTDTTFSINNRFDVEYDTIIRTEIYGQLGYHLNEKIRINLDGHWFFNEAVYEIRPWNLPQYEFTLTGSYNLGDKIIASLEAYVIGGRFAKRYAFGLPPAGDENYVLKLTDFADLNLMVEYRYSKRLSGYLRLSNIVSRKYDLWLDYPAWGINVNGGVTYSF